MTWWCSGAIAVPWDWAPRFYPGIWLALVALAAGYGVMVRRTWTGVSRPEPRQIAAALTAWIVLWATTDWPIGRLAAGYLLSASMVQLLAYSYVVAPLLVYGVPRGLRESWVDGGAPAPLRFLIRRPLAAFGLWNAVIIATHVPAVADALKALQVGMMAMDVLWLGSAVLFWWSLDASAGGEAASVRFGRQVLYLLGSKAVPAFLGALLAFHNFPLYETYEFANRVWPDFTALDDQQTAGLLMWEGMTPLLLLRLGLTFRAWYVAEQLEAPESGERTAA